MIDLHIHSTASDGTDSPEVIMEKCSRLRLLLCSVTDHDTIGAQPVCIKEAARLGVPYITGVEFSVQKDEEFHILGYGVDINNTELVDTFRHLQASRAGRIKRIVALLCECGKKITYDDVLKYSKGKSVGRPHVAQVLIDKGYAGSFDEAFREYLNESGCCFVPREKISQETAVSLILKAGGYPVLAHPKFIKQEQLAGLVTELKSLGLWGIEAYYPVHTDSEAQRYASLAESMGLYVTAGSDYHGKIKARAALACEKRGGALLAESLKILEKKTT